MANAMLFLASNQRGRGTSTSAVELDWRRRTEVIVCHGWRIKGAATRLAG
jgi:hypothetical protein